MSTSILNWKPPSSCAAPWELGRVGRVARMRCELDRFQFVTGSLETRKKLILELQYQSCLFWDAVWEVYSDRLFSFRSSVLGNRYSMDQHGWKIDENSTSLQSVLNFASKLKSLQLWVHQIRGETAEPGIRFCLVPLFNRHLLHSNISFLQNSLKLTQHPQKRKIPKPSCKNKLIFQLPIFQCRYALRTIESVTRPRKLAPRWMHRTGAVSQTGNGVRNLAKHLNHTCIIWTRIVAVRIFGMTSNHQRCASLALCVWQKDSWATGDQPVANPERGMMGNPLNSY